LTGTFVVFDMANVFLWGSALYVGLFQALALSARNRWIKRAAETMLAFGAALVFVFLYFYLDLRLTLANKMSLGMMTQGDYVASLDIRVFIPAFRAFFQSPQNSFMVFGASTFGLILLASKVKILSLRARIAALFGTARLNERPSSPEQALGQGAHVTVLSADVRDFTALAERVTAERAVAILNRYYELWIVAAERHGGRVAGLTGDSVIIVFGLLGDKDSGARALACAEDFYAELPGLRDDLNSASLPAPAGVSVGIHAGAIVAGDLGATGSRRLGVFGDAVSIAARLDSLCREFKQDLLLSQSVFSQLQLETQSRLVRIGEVLLRNSTQPLPVYGLK
jgi:class 3 adenylate cyclase